MLTSTTFHLNIKYFTFWQYRQKLWKSNKHRREVKDYYESATLFLFHLATIRASIRYTVRSDSNQIDNNLFFWHLALIILSNSVFNFYPIPKPIIISHFAEKEANPIIMVVTCRVGTEFWMCVQFRKVFGWKRIKAAFEQPIA